MFKPRISSLRIALLGALVSGGDGTWAAVTFLDHVPSPAEIAAAWRVTRSPENSLKWRGVEWQSMEEPSGTGMHAVAEVESPALALPVHFDSGLAQVSRASMAYVAAIAVALQQDPGLKITVEGHTDSAGTPRGNLMLSWERAFAVFRLLVDRYGIDPARLMPVGKGCNEPLVDTVSAHPLNRRVQFRAMLS